MGRKTVIHTYICSQCGATITKTGTMQKRYALAFCSIICSGKYKSLQYKGQRFNDKLDEYHEPGKNHPHWKGGTISSQGYRIIRVDKKTILEHRFVVEQSIGRKLLRTEHVHHINHDKLDNRIENLELMKDAREHALKYHSTHSRV